MARGGAADQTCGDAVSLVFLRSEKVSSDAAHRGQAVEDLSDGWELAVHREDLVGVGLAVAECDLLRLVDLGGNNTQKI